MNKIAIVIPRYGKEINGGAELHASQIADHLKDQYKCTILTTCMNDLVGINNYTAGNTIIEDIEIIRFKSDNTDRRKHDKAFRYLHKSRLYAEKKLTLDNFLSLLPKKIKYKKRNNKNQLFNNWIETQDPHCPELIHYIKNNKDTYSAFIFFGYLSYTTYVGLEKVSEKSILVPIAHNEPTLYFEAFNQVFIKPQYILYNSLAEKQLVETIFPEAKSTRSIITGLGFNKPIVDLDYDNNVKINYPYFIYIGRIHEHKGCKEMLEYFLEYKRLHNNNCKLVMIGRNFMTNIISSDDIIYLGFIEEKEKLFYLQHCEALIIPSLHESLSMVALEAMYIGKPVLANGGCDVLKDHIEISKAGYTFIDQNEFIEHLNKIINLSVTEKTNISNNGIAYVDMNYQWSVVIDKYNKAIEYIKNPVMEE